MERELLDLLYHSEEDTMVKIMGERYESPQRKEFHHNLWVLLYFLVAGAQKLLHKVGGTQKVFDQLMGLLEHGSFSQLPRAKPIVLWVHSCAYAPSGAASLDRESSGNKGCDVWSLGQELGWVP